MANTADGVSSATQTPNFVKNTLLYLVFSTLGLVFNILLEIPFTFCIFNFHFPLFLLEASLLNSQNL